jgi:hypothetical protein
MGRVLPLAVLVGLLGCGGSPSSPSPQPQTLTFTPTVSGLGFAQQDVSILQPSQMTATLRWTDGDKDLDLYWTNAQCVIVNASFVGAGCQVLSQSLSTAGTLETVSGPVTSGSIVRLFAINFAAAPEPVTLTVLLQP